MRRAAFLPYAAGASEAEAMDGPSIPTGGRSGRRRTWVLPLVSCTFSLAAFICQSLYGGWHWHVIALRRGGIDAPAWMSWALIDTMHMLAMLFAVSAFATAVVAIRHGMLAGGLVALAISLPVGWFALMIT